MSNYNRNIDCAGLNDGEYGYGFSYEDGCGTCICGANNVFEESSIRQACFYGGGTSYDGSPTGWVSERNKSLYGTEQDCQDAWSVGTCNTCLENSYCFSHQTGTIFNGVGIQCVDYPSSLTQTIADNLCKELAGVFQISNSENYVASNWECSDYQMDAPGYGGQWYGTHIDGYGAYPVIPGHNSDASGPSDPNWIDAPYGPDYGWQGIEGYTSYYSVTQEWPQYCPDITSGGPYKWIDTITCGTPIDWIQVGTCTPPDNVPECLVDCAGEYGGTAYYDNTCVDSPGILGNVNQMCVGGNTGLEPAVGIDDCGQCYGGWTEIERCTGIDECGQAYGGWACVYFDGSIFGTIGIPHPQGGIIYVESPCGPCGGIDECGQQWGGWAQYPGYFSIYSDWEGIQLFDTPCDGIDECGDPYGGWTNNIYNRNDLGCGCFMGLPEWFHIDQNLDCELLGNSYNPINNCDVTETSQKQFCRELPIDISNITSYTCGFGDFTGGTTDCQVPYFNPIQWVNCDEGDCEFVESDYPDDGSSGVPVLGCMDSNADNYNPDATFGYIPSECNYTEEVGMVTIRHSFTKYVLNNSDDNENVIFTVNCYNDDNELLDSVQMLLDDSGLYYEAICDARIDGGESYEEIKYTFHVEDVTGDYVSDNINHSIIVDKRIPTYVDEIKDFWGYRGEFIDIGTSLPLFIMGNVGVDLNQSPPLIPSIVLKAEMDEVVYPLDFDDMDLDDVEVFTALTPMNESYWMKSNIPFDTNENYEFEILGMNGDNHWYLDSLNQDKTNIKNALVYDLWENMDIGYIFDFRFIDLTFNGTYQSQFKSMYHGTYLLREQLTPERLGVSTSEPEQITITEYNAKGSRTEVKLESMPFQENDIVEISGETAMGEANDADLSASHYNGTWQVCNIDGDEIWIKSLCIGPQVAAGCSDDECYEADYESIGLNINTQSNCEGAGGYWILDEDGVPWSGATCNGIEPNNDIHPDAEDNLTGTAEKVSLGGSFVTRWINGEPIDITGSYPGHDNIIVDPDSFFGFYLINELSLNADGFLNFITYSTDGINMKFLITDDFSNSFTSINSDEENPINYLEKGYTGAAIEDALYNESAITHFIGNITDNTGSSWLEFLNTRWNLLRGDIFDIENIHNRIDYYYDYLKNAILMDNKRWNYIDIETYETYEDVINSFKEWIENRINHIDKTQVPTCCTDTNASNYNPDCNYDGICTYNSNKTITFELDTTYVNHPPVENIELEIIKKTVYENGEWKFKEVNEIYNLEQIRNNIWSIKLNLSDEFVTEGHKIEYRFIKYIPNVYSVESGAIEYDKSRFLVIGYEKDIVLSHYFNDFIDNFEKTNLPIIKIDTVNYNDMGWVDTHNPNLWYCPGYIDERGIIDGWGSNETDCIDQLNYISGNDITKGYYQSKVLCETNTNCTIDCTDGTNLWDEPKVSGWMDLIYGGENTIHHKNDIPQLSTKIGIEVRGFSSRGFPKKQYAIETQEVYSFPQCDDDAGNYNLFCNGFSPEEGEEYNEDCFFTKENDFVLLGPYRDRTYIRNALTYELWDDMGNPSSNSKHVEFILNGVYQGIFVMFEKPKDDEYRMNIGDNTLECELGECDASGENFIFNNQNYCCTGGYIVKIESGGEQEYFVMDDGFTKVEYYEPDEWDNESGGEVEKNFISYKVISSNNNIDMLDQNSFIDYMISQELAQNNEGYTRSQYWMMKDGEYDKFYQGYIWDMNHAYGAVLDYSAYWSFLEFFAVGDVWKNFIAENEHNIYDSWVNYRSSGNIYDVKNLLERIEDISDSLKLYNSIDRDNQRWFYSNSQDYDYEFSKFKGWLFSRIAWIDATMCNIGNEKFLYNFTAYRTRDYFGCQWSPDPDNCNLDDKGFTYETVGWYGDNASMIANGNSYEDTNLTMTECIFNDDFDKTFLLVISPERNKVFDISDTKFIEFNWISSVDLWLYSHYRKDDSGFRIPADIQGDGIVKFQIRNADSGELIHSFTSSNLSGFTKFEIPSYIWNITKYENIIGNYYIIGDYKYYHNITGEEIVISNKSYFSIVSGTKKQGCTDPIAINYNEFVTIDDGSCKYQSDCDEKYLVERLELENVRTFNISSGYNILSYPFSFTLEDVDFFDVLNSSYIAYDNGTFSEYDSVTTNFDGKLYSAVYMNGVWKSTNTDGLNINDIKPGMGIILETSKSGIISWKLPGWRNN